MSGLGKNGREAKIIQWNETKRTTSNYHRHSLILIKASSIIIKKQVETDLHIFRWLLMLIKVKLKLAGHGAHDLDYLMPHISNRKLKVRKTVFG